MPSDPPAGGLWGWAWAPVLCFLWLPDLSARLCSGMNRATSSDSSTEHAPNRKGGPGMMLLCRERHTGMIQARGQTQPSKQSEKLNRYLIRRVSHVGFGGLAQSFHLSHFVQLHVEEIEDKAIERRPQAVTQTPNSSDHPLHHTWGQSEEQGRCLQLSKETCLIRGYIFRDI